ncbi:MAG: peptide deformylase [Candidatus Peregrinibacteria bacterium]|nr:peptide deformylase [Candidatus Peregrinibacteria bacterium]MDZ4245126.1 peptide deformylase [Candidatus Gracilibacteria bacterium]
MAIREIQTGLKNPILRTKSKEVEKITPEVKHLIRDMYSTLHLDGIGLSAPQVGENLRIVLVTTYPQTKKEKTYTMINPVITYFSEETEISEEGCLSLPNYFGNVARSKEVILQFRDENWKIQIMRLNSLNARIVQHEIDHIDAILFADKVTGKAKATHGPEEHTL